jgi:hypothetical protein
LGLRVEGSRAATAWNSSATSRDACVDLVYIDPAPVSEVQLPFNSNRNYEVFWGETEENRAFEDRHASAQAYIVGENRL